MLFFPLTSSLNGPPYCIGESTTCQLLSFPAFVFRLCPLKTTVMFSPAPAHPQILTGLSLCSTMLLVNNFGKWTLAKEKKVVTHAKNRIALFLITADICIECYLKN